VIGLIEILVAVDAVRHDSEPEIEITKYFEPNQRLKP
jgi:hypothetical protein